MVGSSRSRKTSVNRLLLVSKSKIPPKGVVAFAQIDKPISDNIDLFSFHGGLLNY